VSHAALWLYSLLVWLAQPLVRGKLARRARAEPGYGRAVAERFGYYARPLDSLMPHSSTSGQGSFLWIHAVSLGETRAAATLLVALRAQWPDMRLLLTHGTATGRAEGEKLLLPGDVQVWQPWDTRGAVDRFLRQFHPAVGILMETEVWPNLAAGCRARGVPLVLANARLSEKSLASALRLGPLARAAYGALTAVWAQTEADAARLAQLGAPVRGVLGNLKFDAAPDADQLAQAREWRAPGTRPVLLLASSREGEEVLWLENFKKNTPPAPAGKGLPAIDSEASGRAAKPLWLIVPRHPQRFDEVFALLSRAGLAVARRSQWGQPPQDADVWLGDALGEMALYYGLADVALLGGSFAPLGGQNLIEAAACGCPVVMGPHTFNFAEVAEQAAASGAALRVADMGEGLRAARDWAADGPRLAAARAQATQFAAARGGGAQSPAGTAAGARGVGSRLRRRTPKKQGRELEHARLVLRIAGRRRPGLRAQGGAARAVHGQLPAARTARRCGGVHAPRARRAAAVRGHCLLLPGCGGAGPRSRRAALRPARHRGPGPACRRPGLLGGAVPRCGLRPGAAPRCSGRSCAWA